MQDLVTIVREAQAGDGPAFAELVRRFEHMAVGYALARLGDFHQAEDVAQEAFLEAYRELPRLQQPAAFPTVLRKIVAKHCDRFTRRKRPHAVALNAADAVAARSAAPAEAVAARESRARLGGALAALPQPERIALALYYIRQRPLAEVAAFLDVPLSTVKNRLHTARKKLQKRMLTMVEDELATRGPDDALARRVMEAVATFTAKGPADGHMDSEWHRRMIGQIGQLAAPTEENFRIACALARSPHAAARYAAATPLLLQRDPRGVEELRSLLADPSAAVRRQALRAYAASLEHSAAIWVDICTKATAVPAGVGSLLPMLRDPNVKVRYNALQFLGRYASLGNAEIDAALAAFLSDPTHRFQHAAALAMERPCPSCQTVPARRPAPPGSGCGHPE